MKQLGQHWAVDGAENLEPELEQALLDVGPAAPKWCRGGLMSQRPHSTSAAAGGNVSFRQTSRLQRPHAKPQQRPLSHLLAHRPSQRPASKLDARPQQRRHLAALLEASQHVVGMAATDFGTAAVEPAADVRPPLKLSLRRRPPPTAWPAGSAAIWGPPCQQPAPTAQYDRPVAAYRGSELTAQGPSAVPAPALQQQYPPAVASDFAEKDDCPLQRHSDAEKSSYDGDAPLHAAPKAATLDAFLQPLRRQSRTAPAAAQEQPDGGLPQAKLTIQRRTSSSSFVRWGQMPLGAYVQGWGCDLRTAFAMSFCIV